MLGHALRRLLWSLPALIGVSIVTFWFLSYVPLPEDDPAAEGPLSSSRARPSRADELPRFLNLAPRDVRARAEELGRVITSGGPGADDARVELTRLGGAALPFVLPQLDALAPDHRQALATALAPIARRMGIATAEVDDPA